MVGGIGEACAIRGPYASSFFFPSSTCLHVWTRYTHPDGRFVTSIFPFFATRAGGPAGVVSVLQQTPYWWNWLVPAPQLHNLLSNFWKGEGKCTPGGSVLFLVEDGWNTVVHLASLLLLYWIIASFCTPYLEGVCYVLVNQHTNLLAC